MLDTKSIDLSRDKVLNFETSWLLGDSQPVLWGAEEEWDGHTSLSHRHGEAARSPKDSNEECPQTGEGCSQIEFDSSQQHLYSFLL